jgi:hypothetical protein
MDVIIWLVLTALSLFFTLIMIALEDYENIYGFGLVISIISCISWIIAGLSVVDLTSLQYVYIDGVPVEYMIHYSNSWVISIFYILASIFPFLNILKRIPETWKFNKKDYI